MAPFIPLAMQLASFVPGIVNLLDKSGKAGEVAGKVIEIARGVTGISEPKFAVQAIQADVGKQAEFQLAFGAQQADLERMYLADTQSARARDVEFLHAGKRNMRADIMVLLDVVGLIACLVVLCFYRDKIPGEATGLISTIAATFGLCLRDAHQFEFGSSRTSRDKDATISAMSKA